MIKKKGFLTGIILLLAGIATTTALGLNAGDVIISIGIGIFRILFMIG